MISIKKYLIAIGLLAATAASAEVAPDEKIFKFWNKTEAPVFFLLAQDANLDINNAEFYKKKSTEQDQQNPYKTIQEIKPGKSFERTIDTNKATYLYMTTVDYTQWTDKQVPFGKISFAPHKHILIKWVEKKIAKNQRTTKLFPADPITAGLLYTKKPKIGNEKGDVTVYGLIYKGEQPTQKETPLKTAQEEAKRSTEITKVSEEKMAQFAQQTLNDDNPFLLLMDLIMNFRSEYPRVTLVRTIVKDEKEREEFKKLYNNPAINGRVWFNYLQSRGTVYEYQGYNLVKERRYDGISLNPFDLLCVPIGEERIAKSIKIQGTRAWGWDEQFTKSFVDSLIERYFKAREKLIAPLVSSKDVDTYKRGQELEEKTKKLHSRLSHIVHRALGNASWEYMEFDPLDLLGPSVTYSPSQAEDWP